MRLGLFQFRLQTTFAISAFKEGLNQNEDKTNENKGHSRHTDVAIVKLYYLLGRTILLCNNSVIFVKLYSWK